MLSSGRPSAGVLSGKGCWGSCFAFPTGGSCSPGAPLAGVRHIGPQSGAGLSPGLRRVELLGSRGRDTVAVAGVVAPVSEVTTCGRGPKSLGLTLCLGGEGQGMIWGTAVGAPALGGWRWGHQAAPPWD